MKPMLASVRRRKTPFLTSLSAFINLSTAKPAKARVAPPAHGGPGPGPSPALRCPRNAPETVPSSLEGRWAGAEGFRLLTYGGKVIVTDSRSGRKQAPVKSFFYQKHKALCSHQLSAWRWEHN